MDLRHWAEIPIMTKSELRTHLDELKSNDIESRRAYERFTGGSTGIPAVLLQDSYYWQRNVAYNRERVPLEIPLLEFLP